MMEKYYFIREDNSKTGIPIFLEGVIREQFIEKGEYIKDCSLPPEKTTPIWKKPITLIKTVKMPEKLFLINKHRKIDFDMYYHDGFIVSYDFKKIIDANNHPQYVSSRLEICTREGECNAKKEYWFIKFIEPSPCIDFSKSEVKLFDKNSKLEQPAIDKYLNKLVLNSNLFIPKELFWIYNSYINNYLFCNQETVKAIKNAKIKTVLIAEIESLFDYLYESRLINQKTKLVIE